MIKNFGDGFKNLKHKSGRKKISLLKQYHLKLKDKLRIFDKDSLLNNKFSLNINNITPQYINNNILLQFINKKLSLRCMNTKELIDRSSISIKSLPNTIKIMVNYLQGKSYRDIRLFPSNINNINHPWEDQFLQELQKEFQDM